MSPGIEKIDVCSDKIAKIRASGGADRGVFRGPPRPRNSGVQPCHSTRNSGVQAKIDVPGKLLVRELVLPYRIELSRGYRCTAGAAAISKIATEKAFPRRVLGGSSTIGTASSSSFD